MSRMWKNRTSTAGLMNVTSGGGMDLDSDLEMAVAALERRK